MIIWQGFGFLALIIPIVGYVLVGTLAGTIFGADYITRHAWPGALGVLLSAVALWFLAFKLNVPGRELIDPRTGQTVILRKKHTLFFIPMKYLAILTAVIALVMLFLPSATTK